MSEITSTPFFKTIHPDYKVVGYDGTSRVYSTNPSLSQIPKVLRYAIVPHEGNKFLYADLKAAEVYILVKWAKCESLIDAY
jgi:DNA polymerase I-like protein with 3'-5' exonuclease and polymerase domains